MGAPRGAASGWWEGGRVGAGSECGKGEKIYTLRVCMAIESIGEGFEPRGEIRINNS